MLDLGSLTLGAFAALARWMDGVPAWAEVRTYLWIIGVIVAVRTAVDIVLGL